LTVVLVLGTVLTVANIYWIVLADALFRITHITVQSIAFNAVFCLFLLILVNLALQRFLPRLALSKPELLMIYMMMCMGSTVGGHGFMHLLIPTIGHAHWFATPENDWANLIWPHLPSWMTLSDRSALTDHYRGESSLYTTEHLKAWLAPTLTWSIFIFALILVMLMIDVLLRRQWVEYEKLTYPIIQLPLRLIQEPLSLLGNRLFWGGFAIAAGLDGLNQFHHMFPAIPGIHLKLHDLQRYFTTPPWSGVGWFPVSFYPFVIGMGFFVPLDLLFSCWFFYLFWKAQRVVIYAFGLSSRGGGYAGYQAMIEQSTGAYIGLCLIAVWVSRRYIIRAVKTALGLDDMDDSGEPMSYRSTLLLIVFGFLFLIAFSYAAGMSPGLAIAFFVIYLMVSVAVARMRVEMGAPVHDIHYGGPDLLIPPTMGTRRLGPANLTILAIYGWFNRTRYSDAMPHQLEGFKLAEQTGADSRKLLFVMVFAIVISIFATFWVFLDASHRLGLEATLINWAGWEIMNRLQVWLTTPTDPNPATPISVSVGMLFTFFLAAMRMRFLWWPFHPAGYAVSNSWGMAIAWFPLFIAWVIKSLLMRHGGLKVYRQAAPLFMGLMLGEFVVGCILSIIGTTFRITVYEFWVY
jgi:hypothetical protein